MARKRRNTLAAPEGAEAPSVLAPVTAAADAASSGNGSNAPIVPPKPAPEPLRVAKPEPKPEQPAAGEGAADHAPRQTAQKFPFRLPLPLLDELRDAAVHLGCTMNGIGVEAVQSALERLRQEANDGEPFPKRTHEPRPGRRISA